MASKKYLLLIDGDSISLIRKILYMTNDYEKIKHLRESPGKFNPGLW